MPTVLVIDDDEWVRDLLANAIREAGYHVETCSTASDGIEMARRTQPDCVVCDLDLPDRDGFWVARTLRAETARVALSPFLFLSKHDEPRRRAQGFEVGADVFITKPFHVDEVLAQVRALVAMAERLQNKHAPVALPFPPIDGSRVDEGAAIEGAIGQVSIASLLTVFEMEQRTGSFEVAGNEHHAKLELAAGRAVEGSVDGAPTPPVETLRAMLSVDQGYFTLWPRTPSTAPPGSQPIGELLVRARGPSTSPPPHDATTRPSPATPLEPPRPAAAPKRAPIPRVNDDAIEVEADLSSYRPPRGAG